jgi:hypothetical protein
MSLLLYGIVETDGERPFGAGLDGGPLRGVVEQPLLAVVSEHAGAAPEPSAATLTAYERIVARLMDRGTILPARFGSMLDDEPEVRALLRRRREDLVARLRRVRGAVEISLRASWREATRPQSDSSRPQSDDGGTQRGTAYLRQRLELRQSARRVAGELDSLKPLALSSRRTLAPRPDVPLLDAYLVDRARVDEFVALVEQIDVDLDDVDLVCTGPWPPYSFAEGAPV